MENVRSDCILREILEERKSLSGFLDAIFGFLSRNTDFYHTQKTKNDKLGLPIGAREQIVMTCIQKYELPSFESKLPGDMIDDGVTLVANEVEIVAEESIEKTDNESSENNQNEMAATSKHVENPEATIKFSLSDYKNGSIFEKYCWSQTLKDIELNVLLPKEVKLAKHIIVNLKPNHITIKTLIPKEEILIKGQTWNKYRHNDALWSITDGKLIISFDKFNDSWWDRLFLGEVSIDVKTVDTERSIKDYSQDTQKVIEKLQIRQNLVNMPLNENEQIARLREGWNTDDSPFKGQPFNPSAVQFI